MDLRRLPAHELVRSMTSGSVSCREIMRAHPAQIGRVNRPLNALVEAADPEQCLRPTMPTSTALASRWAWRTDRRWS